MPDRVMSLKLEVEGVMLNVFAGHVLQVGCELKQQKSFRGEIDVIGNP